MAAGVCLADLADRRSGYWWKSPDDLPSHAPAIAAEADSTLWVVVATYSLAGSYASRQRDGGQRGSIAGLDWPGLADTRNVPCREVYRVLAALTRRGWIAGDLHEIEDELGGRHVIGDRMSGDWPQCRSGSGHGAAQTAEDPAARKKRLSAIRSRNYRARLRQRHAASVTRDPPSRAPKQQVLEASALDASRSCVTQHHAAASRSVTQRDAPPCTPLGEPEREGRAPPIVPPRRGGRRRRSPFDREIAGEQERAEFEMWFPTFPNRVKRLEALAAFVEARQHASLPELIAGSERYAQLLAGPKPPTAMNPAKWLRHRRWLDEPFVPAIRRSAHQTLADTARRVAARRRREMELSGELGAEGDQAHNFVQEATFADVEIVMPDPAARARPRSPHQTLADASRRVAAARRRQMELSGELGTG
jgi:hypothetical protein